MRCAYPWMNVIFIEIQWCLIIVYYLWLTSISHASKSVFVYLFIYLFFINIFLLLFCSFCTNICCFFFFSYLFLLHFCVWIFSNFLVFTHTNSFFFFFEVVYMNNKVQKDSLRHKPLFECLFILHGSIHLCILCFSFHSIPLSFASLCIRFFFFFFSYLFHFCVDIFKLFTQIQTLTNIFPKVFPFYF